MTPELQAQITILQTPDDPLPFELEPRFIEAGYAVIGKRLAHVTAKGAIMLGVPEGKQVKIDLIRRPNDYGASRIFDYRTGEYLGGSASCAFDPDDLGDAALIVRYIDQS